MFFGCWFVEKTGTGWDADMRKGIKLPQINIEGVGNSCKSAWFLTYRRQKNTCIFLVFDILMIDRKFTHQKQRESQIFSALTAYKYKNVVRKSACGKLIHSKSV